MISETTRVNDIRKFVRDHLERINNKYTPEKKISNEDVDEYISGNPYFNFETRRELNDPVLVNKVLDEKYEGYVEELYQNILVWIC